MNRNYVQVARLCRPQKKRGRDGGLAVRMLVNSLASRISEVMTDIDDLADNLEEQVLTRESYELRPMIADIRRQAIALRRYLAPQRDALFLPLGFVTGLPGINVGGMPGVDDERAFAMVCFVLIVLMVLQYLIFRRLKWFEVRRERHGGRK